MAEQTRAPTSDEAVAGTWTGSAGSRFAVVDDYPDTAGTDELTHGTTAGTLTFGFSAFTVPSVATSITVLVDYYDYKNGSQACTFGGRLKVGASYFNAATHNPANGSANRTQRTDTWANNPATSAAWTVDQVNGTAGSNNLVAFGYNSGSDASPTITTSSIRLRVTYTANYPITAEQGTFALTGNDAAFAVTRKLVADAASFSVGGQDATLRVGMPADVGAFTLTGSDATLTYTPSSGATMQADTGAFTFTGNAAGVAAQRRVTAATGSFTLTGIATGLLGQRKVGATVGAFTLTGNAAAFSLGKSMVAAAGAFALTGQAATFAVVRKLVADVAAFVLSGATATLGRTEVNTADMTSAVYLYARIDARTVPAATINLRIIGDPMALHVGDVAEIEINIRVRGAYTDPSALSVVVQEPDDTTTEYDFPSDELEQRTENGQPLRGRYRALIPCTAEGTWRYTVSSPGPTAQAATSGRFKVYAVTPEVP